MVLVPTNGAPTPSPNGVDGGGHEAANGSESAQSPDLVKLIENLNSEFREYREKSDGRLAQLGRDLGRLRSSGKVSEVSEPAPEPQKPTQPQKASEGHQSFTANDLLSAIEVRESLDSLPEKGRRHIDELRQSGATIAEIANAVKLMRLGIEGPPATGGEPASATRATDNRTRERPAMAPPRAAIQHPRTLSEYFRLARENPDLKKQLDKDPTFHPDELPTRE